MREKNRHKLTVVTHRNQEQFNVEVINFKNISFYVQREINNILRDYKKFCRAYIDDIIIFSKILNEHQKHLNAIFNLFNRLYIKNFFIKSFLEYFSVQLLKLKVNAFELSTSIEKLKAISKLKFLVTLRNLKIYLKFIE